MPAGGAFPGANRQLAAAEAGTISNLYRDKISEALAGLSGYSQGTTSAALNANSGASSAAQWLAQMAQSRSSSIANGLGGLAGLFGTYFGGGFGRRNAYPGTPPYVAPNVIPAGGGGAGAYATGTQRALS